MPRSSGLQSMRSHSTDRLFTFQCPRSWFYVMALSHVRKNSQASGKATTKRRPCRYPSVAWLQERRCHPIFGKFQTAAGANGKASLHSHKSFMNIRNDAALTIHLSYAFFIECHHKYNSNRKTKNKYKY